MKKSLLPLIFLTLLVPACAGKHYSRLRGDEVSFYYKDPEALEVFFASSLDNYKLLSVRKERKHLWEVTLPAGEAFAYFYVVDGVITLPDCPYTENDDFGSRNCLYIADM